MIGVETSIDLRQRHVLYRALPRWFTPLGQKLFDRLGSSTLPDRVHISCKAIKRVYSAHYTYLLGLAHIKGMRYHSSNLKWAFSHVCLFAHLLCSFQLRVPSSISVVCLPVEPNVHLLTTVLSHECLRTCGWLCEHNRKLDLDTPLTLKGATWVS